MSQLTSTGALAGRAALVTGSSRGIGKAIALELAAHGANVVINYHRDRNAAEQTAREVEALGVRAPIFEANVADENAANRLIDLTVGELGTIDVLVCNAGIVISTLAALQSVSDWRRTFDVNLLGVFLCIRSAIPHMISARGGSIVCVSSLAAERGSAGLASYAASKGGINALVRALAVELGKKGIRVNGVAPGLIDTEMIADVPPHTARSNADRIPLARLGRADEVARVVRFLACDDASYMTGQIVAVDGGLGI